MFTFKIKIANNTVKINAIFKSTEHFCKKYIVDDASEEDISVDITQGIIDEERRTHEAAIAKEHGGNDAHALNVSDAYLEVLALYRQIIEKLTWRGVMMLHGSAIAVDGEAYIFTAKSGTGKSTHTRLWREYLGERAVMVNDDKPLITFRDGIAYVHGTPWNGKHNIDNNISVPIKAICVLERNSENYIEKLEISEAFPFIYVQAYRAKSPENLAKTLSLIDSLLKSVKVYRLGCNMDISAARVAYEGMK